MGRDRQEQRNESIVLFVVRHGHRSDRDGQGSAVQWAKRCPAGHEHDPFLSTTGNGEGRSTGELFASLLERNLISRVRRVVSSPLTRCVQTAAHILTQLPAASHPSTIELDAGLYEALVPNLFPNGPPPHLLTPHWASLAEGTQTEEAPSSTDEEATTAAPSSTNRVRPSQLHIAYSSNLQQSLGQLSKGSKEDQSLEAAYLQSMFPETNNCQKQRAMKLIEQVVSESFPTLHHCSTVDNSNAKKNKKDQVKKASTTAPQAAPEALIVVTHQCIASAVVKGIMDTHTVGGEKYQHPEGKGSRPRDAWKREALRLHTVTTVGGEQTGWPLQKNAQFQFDTCSVTAMVLDRLPTAQTEEIDEEDAAPTKAARWTVASIPLLSYKEHTV